MLTQMGLPVGGSTPPTESIEHVAIFSAPTPAPAEMMSRTDWMKFGGVIKLFSIYGSFLF